MSLSLSSSPKDDDHDDPLASTADLADLEKGMEKNVSSITTTTTSPTSIHTPTTTIMTFDNDDSAILAEMDHTNKSNNNPNHNQKKKPTISTTTTSLWTKLFWGRNNNNQSKINPKESIHSNGEENKVNNYCVISRQQQQHRRFDCPICLEEFADNHEENNADNIVVVVEEEDNSSNNMLQRITIPQCQHDFCQECLRTYCEHCIHIRKVPIPCPQQQNAVSNSSDCPTRLTNETVKTILLSNTSNSNHSDSNNNVLPNRIDLDGQKFDYGTIQQLDDETNQADADHNKKDENQANTLWQRYWKLIRLSQDPTLCECPHCYELVSIRKIDNNSSSNSLDSTKEKNLEYNNSNDNHDAHYKNTNDHDQDEETLNDLHCSECENSFCKIHGLAHAGLTCAEFRRTKAAKALEQNEEALKRYTKQCSHCGSYIQKSNGCDHVICTHCHSDMCWKCGTHVHLSGTAIRHCSNCQRDYRDHRYDHLYRVRLCLCFPLVLPFVVVWIALVGTVAIMTGCFGCCWCFGRCCYENNSNGTVKTAKIGVLATLLTIFLPIFVLLEDFGVHLSIFDELYPETPNEMPFLETERKPNDT